MSVHRRGRCTRTSSLVELGPIFPVHAPCFLFARIVCSFCTCVSAHRCDRCTCTLLNQGLVLPSSPQFLFSYLCVRPQTERCTRTSSNNDTFTTVAFRTCVSVHRPHRCTCTQPRFSHRHLHCTCIFVLVCLSVTGALVLSLTNLLRLFICN